MCVLFIIHGNFRDYLVPVHYTYVCIEPYIISGIRTISYYTGRTERFLVNKQIIISFPSQKKKKKNTSQKGKGLDKTSMIEPSYYNNQYGNSDTYSSSKHVWKIQKKKKKVVVDYGISISWVSESPLWCKKIKLIHIVKNTILVLLLL